MVKRYLFEVLVGYRRLWALIDPLLLIYFFFFMLLSTSGLPENNRFVVMLSYPKLECDDVSKGVRQWQRGWRVVTLRSSSLLSALLAGAHLSLDYNNMQVWFDSTFPLACEQQTHFRSSLLSLRKSEQETYFRSSLLSLRRYFSEGEKRRPEMRLLFAGYLFPLLIISLPSPWSVKYTLLLQIIIIIFYIFDQYILHLWEWTSILPLIPRKWEFCPKEGEKRAVSKFFASFALRL